MYRALFAMLDNSSLILTANQRLSSHLHQQFEHSQLKKNLRAWSTPTILPFSTWISQLWQKTPGTQGTLLSSDEEILLWQSIIESDEQHTGLLQTHATAQLVKQAWQTSKLWQVDLSSLYDQANEETLCFLRWSQAFSQLKDKQSLYCQAELAEELSNVLHNCQNDLAKKIFLVGFDDHPPAIKKLLQQIETLCTVTHFEPEPKNISSKRISLLDQEQEIYTMANWAQQQLDHHKKIACVIPNIASIYSQVARIFSDVFAPENIIPLQPQKTLPFNISSGVAFHQLPMIHTAIKALQWLNSPLKLENLQPILLSPCINSHEVERCLAAALDVELNQHGKLIVDPIWIHAKLTQLTQEFYPHATLATRWQAYYQLKPGAQVATLKSWSFKINAILTALGWPGQHRLSSYEYQIQKRWQTLLLDFAKLDRLFPPVNFAKAINLLKTLAKQTTFQAQSIAKPIQILGTLEASGCEFDALWIMGLTNETWPPQATPNPFLPSNLQRELFMPHAEAQRELYFCKKIQARLFASSKHVVVSHPQQEGDKKLQPSHLIKHLQSVEPHALLDLTRLNLNVHQQTISLEMINDTVGPPVTENEILRGGSTILQNQALCPFRAFAEARLHIRRNEKPEIGLSARERGNICHQALDLIWKQIKSQKNLKQLADDESLAIIDAAINEALQSNQITNDHYFVVEQQRLKKLLTAWLLVEKQRPDFKVLERETQRHIQIGPLAMLIRIDRIDELSNGKQFIIDYKTGNHNIISEWFGERPAQPQLPIYCIYGTAEASGIAYAEVNGKSLEFKGLIDANAGFSKVNSIGQHFKNMLSWQQLNDQWQQSLVNLSIEFYQGIASVNPQHHSVCDRCQLHALCRIGSHHE